MLNQYGRSSSLRLFFPEEQLMDAVNKFRKILTDHGSEIVHENNWGLRKLATRFKEEHPGSITCSSTKVRAR